MSAHAAVTLHDKKVPGDANTLNQAEGTVAIPVAIAPDLPTLGESSYQYDYSQVIRLRQWDEQVLLHEVLHILVGRVLPSDTDGTRLGLGQYHHELINELEVGLTTAGWRYRPPDVDEAGEQP